MEEFKIDIFKHENPGATFPEFRTLSEAECRNLSRRISASVGSPSSSGLQLVLEVARRAPVHLGRVPASETLDIRKVLETHGFACAETVYVNWYRFDVIDAIAEVDLSTHFADIWYPGPDDIDVFDDSFRWIITVVHDGEVRLVKCSGA